MRHIERLDSRRRKNAGRNPITNHLCNQHLTIADQGDAALPTQIEKMLPGPAIWRAERQKFSLAFEAPTTMIP